MAFLFMPVASLQAAGTAAGTPVVNTAIAAFTYGVTPMTMEASVTFVVDNKVNLTVVNNGSATVIPGATDQVLVFVLRNDGNADQRYELAAVNSGDFVMDNIRLYRDDGDTPGELDGNDSLYIDSSTFGDIAVDETLDILIVGDVPTTATSGQASAYDLLATTVDAGTTDVTIGTEGENTDGLDVVFADVEGSNADDGARDGRHSAPGTYTVNAPGLALVKSALIVSDPIRGTDSPRAVEGAVILYTITATASGIGTMENVVITDPIPDNARYSAGTLTLNGAGLTDDAGDDAGGVGGDPLAVTVNLGDMTSESAVQTITFEVVIDLDI